VEQAEAALPEPVAQPEQPDDPEPVKQPVAEETAAPKAAPVYTWPVKGEVLRDFSVETLSLDPTLGDWRTHSGLDIAASAGVEVLAMSAGKVEQVFADDLMGTTVVIDHGDGLTTTYSNLAGRPAVQAGDEVETGTIIGTVGSTAIGESGLGAHLHLEASLNEEPVDPTDYLPDRH
jgi:murein DD-endopeptidase MepM/ murein hydrolase activator NlpD